MRYSKILVLVVMFAFLLSGCVPSTNAKVSNLPTTTSIPSGQTSEPTENTNIKTPKPGEVTSPPTAAPSGLSTTKPTTKPTAKPTSKPNTKHTPKPTAKPTPKPTAKPIEKSMILINEVMSSNTSTIQDENLKFEDWIELYNAGNKDQNLEGYYLSDGTTNMLKWKFPSMVIKAKGYLLVWASKLNYIQANGEPHTNFRLNKVTGEPITLTAPDGVTVVDFVPAKPSTGPDVSYGRKTSGASEWVQFISPTPRNPN